ncbi:MAG: hypothetical protein ACO3VH_00490, partial [Ilumatobacteraceae bacterium]
MAAHDGSLRCHWHRHLGDPVADRVVQSHHDGADGHRVGPLLGRELRGLGVRVLRVLRTRGGEGRQRDGTRREQRGAAGERRRGDVIGAECVASHPMERAGRGGASAMDAATIKWMVMSLIS